MSKFTRNEDIRQMARGKGIPMWAVAEQLDISESALYARLRKHLSDEQRSELIQAIEELANEVG